MKIFCVKGEDYYVLPDSTILRSGNPLFLPEWDDDFRLFPALAVRIDRLGKTIAPKFAGRYYNELSMAAVMMGCGRLRTLREAGRPWTSAVCFDRSCLLGDFIPKEEMAARGYAADYDGEVQECACLPGFGDIDEALAMLSADNTMKTGDVLLLLLPGEGLAVSRGTMLSTRSGDRKLLEIRIK